MSILTDRLNFKPLVTAILKQILLVVAAVTLISGLISWYRFTQLGTADKTWAFDDGAFFVNGEVVGIPLFSSFLFIVSLAIIAKEIYRWHPNRHTAA